MNRNVWTVLILVGFVLTPGARSEEPMDRDRLITALRNGEPVEGRVVTLEVTHAGRQVDQKGAGHELYLSRNADTVLLCLVADGETGGIPADRAVLNGSIIRVELQEQNLMDHRTYALWIDADDEEQASGD